MSNTESDFNDYRNARDNVGGRHGSRSGPGRGLPVTIGVIAAVMLVAGSPSASSFGEAARPSPCSRGTGCCDDAPSMLARNCLGAAGGRIGDILVV